jgi:hypothetical protein
MLQEYSNEVWNWSFEQATYNLQMANRSVVVDGDPFRLNYDSCNNTGYWAWRRTAYMCKHIADIFGAVFTGDVGPNKRVRPVLAGQVANTEVVRQGLVYLEAVWGPPGTIIHAIAGAPYFNLGDEANSNPNLTVDQVIDAMNASITNMSTSFGIGEDNPLAGNLGFAYHYGVQFRCYESGPDTSGPNDSGSLWAKANATIDPRMQDLVMRYERTLAEYGPASGPANYFVAGASPLYEQYGSYGLLYDMTITDTPKLRAIDATRVMQRPPPTIGVPIPTVSFNATDYVGHTVPFNVPWLEYLNAGSTFGYFVRNDQPTAVDFDVVVYTAGSTNSSLEVCFGWQACTTVQTTATQGWSTFVPTTPATFTAPASSVGLVQLNVTVTRAYNIGTLDFTLHSA